MAYLHEQTHPTLDVEDCFACKITHQNLGFHMCPGGKEEWHGATINERRERMIAEAAKKGSRVEPKNTAAWSAIPSKKQLGVT